MSILDQPRTITASQEFGGQTFDFDERELLKEAQEQARFLFVNGSSTSTNATTMALLTGAFLFILLNAAFIMLFVDPYSGKGSSSKSGSNKKTENAEDYFYYDDDSMNFVKR